MTGRVTPPMTGSLEAKADRRTGQPCCGAPPSCRPQEHLVSSLPKVSERYLTEKNPESKENPRQVSEMGRYPKLME